MISNALFLEIWHIIELLVNSKYRQVAAKFCIIGFYRQFIDIAPFR